MRISLIITILQICLSEILPADSFVWNWRDAVLMKSFIDIARCDETRRPEVEEYVLSAMTRLAPKAHGRHPNGVAAGVGLAWLKEIGKNTPETDAALERVLRQYREIPRAANGGCSHRPGRVELWDDTLYMLEIFLLQCYRASGDISYVSELADQVLAHAEHLLDPKTGLWYHGWAESDASYDDACCQKGWNANPLHRNAEFWGRGNGWVAMTLVDLLEVLPRDDARYEKLSDMFRQMMHTFRSRQDRRTGAWRQLPYGPRKKANFPETSCTAMIGYAMQKGVNIGLLPSQYGKNAEKAYSGLLTYRVPGQTASSQCIDLLGVCEGTCIGDRNYYYSRKTTGGQTYATGAFLMLDNLYKNQ